MKYTSSEANKLLKKLDSRIQDLELRERKTSSFRVASGEDPASIRPDYDFAGAQAELEDLMAKVRLVKHAINEFNLTHSLPGFPELTVDQALVYIPQLSKLTEKYRAMASALPKERVTGYSMRNPIIDYDYANYDIGEAEAAYRACQERLADLQLALDSVNNREQMEIAIELD